MKPYFFFLILALTIGITSCKDDPATPATTGTISGMVKNSTGAIVAGAIVTTTPPTSSVTTDANGAYTIPNVVPGAYLVTATKEGMGTGSTTISVAAGKSTTADVVLATEALKNYALRFNDNYISVAPNSQLDLSGGSFTLEAWIKPSDFNGTGYLWILHKGSSNTQTDYLLGVDNFRGVPHIRFASRGLSNDVVSSKQVSLNEWVHIAAVQDVSTAKVRLYINGTFEAEKDIQGLATINSDSLLIAARFGATRIPGEFFHGEVEEVRIWNIARTEQEIKDNMAKTVAANASGLVTYWSFDEGQGNTAEDKSANDFIGSLIRNPQWVISTAPLK